jgi:hypothetical protein
MGHGDQARPLARVSVPELQAVSKVNHRPESRTSTSLYNPFAAAPSVHLGYALLRGAELVDEARSIAFKAAGALYPPVVLLVIVATGNLRLACIGTGVVCEDKSSWPTRGPNAGETIGSTLRSRANRRRKSACKCGRSEAFVVGRRCARLGLSRRRSRVRVPSLPSLEVPANGHFCCPGRHADAISGQQTGSSLDRCGRIAR